MNSQNWNFFNRERVLDFPTGNFSPLFGTDV